VQANEKVFGKQALKKKKVVIVDIVIIIIHSPQVSSLPKPVTTAHTSISYDLSPFIPSKFFVFEPCFRPSYLQNYK